MTDKIKVSATLATLDAEAAPEPYIFGLGDKLLRFPDPMELTFEETDEFLSDLRAQANVGPIFKRWLTEDEYKALQDAKVTGRQAQGILRGALRHYELVMGSQGEDNTSGTA